MDIDWVFNVTKKNQYKCVIVGMVLGFFVAFSLFLNKKFETNLRLELKLIIFFRQKMLRANFGLDLKFEVFTEIKNKNKNKKAKGKIEAKPKFWDFFRQKMFLRQHKLMTVCYYIIRKTNLATSLGVISSPE